MSGGSMDYVCFRIEEQAHVIPDKEIRELAYDFANLMHECEWYTSCDKSKDDWIKAATAFKQKWFGKRDERLKEIIDRECAKLRAELLEMIGEKPE